MCTYQLRSQSRLLRSRRSQCGLGHDDQNWVAHDPFGSAGEGDDTFSVVDALTDPLYQLLVQHVLFCRLTEELLANTKGTGSISFNSSYSTAKHRSKRAPAS